MKPIVEIQDVNAANDFIMEHGEDYRAPEFSEHRGYVFIRKTRQKKAEVVKND